MRFYPTPPRVAWWSFPESNLPSKPSWAKPWRSPACTACWHVTGGASSPPTPIIRRETPRHGMTGKKTPPRFGRNRKELCQGQANAPDVSGRSQIRADQRHALLLGTSSDAAPVSYTHLTLPTNREV